MNIYRMTDGAHALQPTPAIDSDRAEGCGVLRGAMLGGLIWLLLLAAWLAI